MERYMGELIVLTACCRKEVTLHGNNFQELKADAQAQKCTFVSDGTYNRLFCNEHVI